MPTVSTVAKWLLVAAISCGAVTALLSESWRSADHPTPLSKAVGIHVSALPGKPLEPERTADLAASRAIFSDTAMAPGVFSEESRCHEHIRAIVQKISSSFPMVSKVRADGVHYAGFRDKDDNYVLRCFKIGDDAYKLFVSAAGSDRADVSQGLSRIYEAASEPAL